MNPRLSLQGRMSLEWAPGGAAADGGGRAGGEASGRGHGRRSSLYRTQSSTLFNAFEGEEPQGNGAAGEAMGLHLLREEDETEDESDDDEVLEGVDERTSLRKKGSAVGKGLGLQGQRPSGSRSQSHSHSGSPNHLHTSLGDVRIPSPR